MRTVLYEEHVKLGAKMVDFCNWELPIQYAGILSEHSAVRERAGIFDVSHMGRIQIEGAEAAAFIEYVSTNRIKEKKVNSVTYTVFCNEQGGSIDDTLIFKENEKAFFCVANAANRMKVYNHLQRAATRFDVAVRHCFDDEGILAVQGPESIPLLSEIFPQAGKVSPMQFAQFNFSDDSIVLSRTGYTGSDGCEIYAKKETVQSLWRELMQRGSSYGLQPCGLGARDILRMEMGYALYGHELDEEVAPAESVAAWTVKWDKEPFIGLDALLRLKEAQALRRQYGAVLKQKGIAREACPVFSNNRAIGKVTSGTYSPSLKQSIAIIMVTEQLTEGETVGIEVRDKRLEAEIVKLPFYRPEEKASS